VRNFKELRVWQAAHDLTLDVYRVTRTFPRDEIHALTSQIRRSAASVGANLAEGCGRYSDAELARYVQIAMGSASELDYHLLLATDLGLIAKEKYDSLSAQVTSVRKMLTSFQQTLREANNKSKSLAAGATG
jgi:four helix bundle protein